MQRHRDPLPTVAIREPREIEVFPYLLRKLDVHEGEPGMGCGYYVHSSRSRLRLPGRRDRLVSRRVLSWRLSNSMDTSFCVEALEEALERFGEPEIFNTDQGAQFTAQAFVDVLKTAGVLISMDGKGRCIDSVFVERLWRSLKYEDVYLNVYSEVVEARDGIGRYFTFFNDKRPYQSLGYQNAGGDLPDEHGRGEEGFANTRTKNGERRTYFSNEKVTKRRTRKQRTKSRPHLVRPKDWSR